MNSEQRDRKIAGVILAAGKSSRFSGNKLLAEVGGDPLIKRSIDTLLNVPLWETVTVTSGDPSLSRFLKGRTVEIINKDAERGIATSIVTATEYFSGKVDAILFMLADQPLVDQSDVMILVNASDRHPDHIVACFAEGDVRNPVIFPSRYFDELLSLRGDRGAKAIANSHPELLVRIPVEPSHLMDVDTQEDLDRVKAYVIGKKKSG